MTDNIYFLILARISSENMYFFAGIGAIVLMAIGFYVWDKLPKRETGRTDSSQSLFQELAAIHKLKAAEQEQLLSIASSQAIDEPATIFVNPEILEGAIQSSSENKQQWGKLYNKLFSL